MMTVSAELSRRAFCRGASATMSFALPVPLLSFAAGAQMPPKGPLEHWRTLGSLTARATRIGVSAPRMAASVDIARHPGFPQIMTAAVELISSMEQFAGQHPDQTDQVASLLNEAADLLQRVHHEERSPPDERREGMSIAAQPGRPSFESLKDGYRDLFSRCTIREANRSTVEWYVSKLLEVEWQKRWYRVAQSACCPWYFIAITHAMECSFNFRAHLHNGDPLARRTTHVPSGRPKTWNPPSDWESSAVDALQFDGFVDVSDWTLERTLYRWESYNGFRSRKNGINTPYLWSFSNHYTRGKFVADNVWDPNAVSQQCGAAVMLKVMVERGVVTLTA